LIRSNTGQKRSIQPWLLPAPNSVNIACLPPSAVNFAAAAETAPRASVLHVAEFPPFPSIYKWILKINPIERPIRILYICNRSCRGIEVVCKVEHIRPKISRDQDNVRGTGVTNCRYGCLYRAGPEIEIDVVRLVHELESDFRVVLVDGGQRGPECSELLVRWSTLANDAAPRPASVIVSKELLVSGPRLSEILGGIHIYDAQLCRRSYTSLHELVVYNQIGLVQSIRRCSEEVPADWQSKGRSILPR
jgi:hypothetical protein